MVRDEDIKSVAVLDEVQGKVKLVSLGELLRNHKY